MVALDLHKFESSNEAVQTINNSLLDVAKESFQNPEKEFR